MGQHRIGSGEGQNLNVTVGLGYIVSGDTSSRSCRDAVSPSYRGEIILSCTTGQLEVMSEDCSKLASMNLAGEVPATDAAMDQFKNEFRVNLAAAIAVTPEQITVESVQAGSLVVHFFVNPEVEDTAWREALQAKVDEGSISDYITNFVRYEPDPAVDDDGDGVANGLDAFPLD